MAISRNGWDVYESRSHPKLVNFPWITGKIRDGDHFVVLGYIARRINAEVETIIKANSWGHDPRPVRGYTNVWSEHATGCAFDFNAPKNGLGVAISKAFSNAQIRQIRQIIKDVQGAARWGGEWDRPDGMHIELIGGNVKVKAVADLIRAGKLPAVGKASPQGNVKPNPSPTPAPGKAWPHKDLKLDGILGKGSVTALQLMLKDHPSPGVRYTGLVDGQFGSMTRKAVQRWLEWLGAYKGRIDGDLGSMSIKALQMFLKRNGALASKWRTDGIFGVQTKMALQRYINSQAKHYRK